MLTYFCLGIHPLQRSPFVALAKKKGACCGALAEGFEVDRAEDNCPGYSAE
jgi:hypothetical protein